MCRRKTNTCGEASVIELCRRRVGLGGGIGASSIPQLLDEDKKLDGDMEGALKGMKYLPPKKRTRNFGNSKFPTNLTF